MRYGDPKEAAMGPPALLSGARRSGQAGRLSFRFPCGHVESGKSVDRRTRATGRAVWVRCRACNVIGLPQPVWFHHLGIGPVAQDPPPDLQRVRHPQRHLEPPVGKVPLVGYPWA